jgi:hypothetical protein
MNGCRNAFYAFYPKFCKAAIKSPIAALQKSKTLAPQGARFLQIGHAAV